MLYKLTESHAEIVLGLFQAHQRQKMDMVDLDPQGRICEVQIKPIQTNLKYTWITAVWTPAFTHFMHEYLRVNLGVYEVTGPNSDSDQQRELFVGDVIQAAIDDGLKVDAVIFANGSYWDIGTPEDLVNAAHSEITLARSPSNVQTEHIP